MSPIEKMTCKKSPYILRAFLVSIHYTVEKNRVLPYEHPGFFAN